MNRSIKG